jgi:hypothetical protein
VNRGPDGAYATGSPRQTTVPVPDDLLAPARYAVAYGALAVGVEIALERWRRDAGLPDDLRVLTATAEMDRLAATLDRARREVRP